MPPDEIVNRVLREWAEQARRGRPSHFRGWTFFETNCFSELLKQTRNGEGDAVRQFLRGRDILLPGTVLGEIVAAPALAQCAAELLSAANFFLVADVSKFWECDLWNFITMGRHPRDVLETRLISEDFLSGLFAHGPFVDAVKQSRARVAAEYRSRVEPDIGTKLDERELGSVIWSRIDSMAVEWLNLEIPPADVRPERFPAFFTFYYSYYFRYIKSQTRAQVNDFNDLLNTVAAPYCCDYFAERTAAGILKNDVQGGIPPRPIEVARRLNKRGFLPSESLTRAEATPDQTASSGSLLPDVRIWTINDLRQQLSRPR